MATTTDTLPAGGSETPARSLHVSRARTNRRIVLDRWASRLVVLGGVVIIASILAILFVIVGEVWPLFRPPSATLVATRASLGAPPAGGDAVSVDEYRQIAVAITRTGALEFVPLGGAPLPAPVAVPALGSAQVTTVAASAKGGHLLGTSDGRVIAMELKFDVAFRDGKRLVTPQSAFRDALALDPSGKRPIQRLAFAAPDSGPITVAQIGPRELIVQTVVEKKALIGAARREESLETLAVPGEADVTALALDGRGEDLFVGTTGGQVVYYDMRDRANPTKGDAVAVGGAVTALGFLLGDRTLVVGDQKGGVSTWQMVPPPGGGAKRLTRIYQFEPHEAAVVGVTASRRDKGFATTDARGEIKIRYGTSGQTLITVGATEPLRAVTFTPKSDALLAVGERGSVREWVLDNPHPETTFKTVFGRVWYEGYAEPEYVWQSTGGTDDFEAKLSLTPLIFGTLKGTVYALLFAVPMALLAAIYVSEFMHPVVKGYVKPVVEIMAALPSVVLGFLAGLWLAPMIERVVPGLFIMPLVTAVCILSTMLAWRTLPDRLRGRFKPGVEALVLVPVLLGSAWVAFWLGGLVEATLLGGSYRNWLLSALGLTYDQRNSLVVGIAMGFAVIPIIFTIAEDSLANVPQHLRAGSLALGANRWQTAVRIVLPTASPGIFSAIMIGFGRAVGETMIVLMATGNTPIMDWSMFNGFRALSANVAVELPEAPEGGTLFRVLFLAAFLLFCLTFVVNTLAELVRLRLRQKYRYL
ncbi:MAG: ABC transporter permease subunit [Candidatus Rokuibacteriota bacterium]